MSGRVIQGFFIGGRMRTSSLAMRFTGLSGQNASATALGSATDLRFSAAVQTRAASGVSPLAHVAAPQNQSRGVTSIAVDPVRLGLNCSGGQPLPKTLLAKMERAFDADLRAVRVHVGPQPSRIGAIAFTVGNDIYFSPGRYQPDTIHGQQLIGHELTHVIQQRQGRVRSGTGGVSVVHDEMLEVEADRMGARAANLSTHTASGDGDQRASVQRKAAKPGNDMLQPMMAVPPPPPRILGINNRMAHGEALGNTGGKQTTISEAKVNGAFLGKFDNRTSFMNHGVVVNPGNLAATFPAHICKAYWTGGGHNTHKANKPHSEDYVIAALYQEYIRLGGNWAQTYPRNVGQNFDLFSLKLDKTPCPNCARNLIKACNAFGLRLRVKASTMNTAISVTSGVTGSEMLHAGKYGMASVPVRHWTIPRIHNYLANVGKVQSPYIGGFANFQVINNAATNMLPLGANAELTWGAIGYGRKANQGNW